VPFARVDSRREKALERVSIRLGAMYGAATFPLPNASASSARPLIARRKSPTFALRVSSI
jgi:hypothetical protein